MSNKLKLSAAQKRVVKRLRKGEILLYGAFKDWNVSIATLNMLERNGLIERKDPYRFLTITGKTINID